MKVRSHILTPSVAREIAVLCAAVFVASAHTARAEVPNPWPVPESWRCDHNSALCAEVANSLNYDGIYTGHDEPALLFYSDRPGSGNSNRYVLTLPQDPPTLPLQDGTGGTFNFQLHVTFWFGMVMCDTESYPNFSQTCTPNSDANIFDNPDPMAADYVGHHPGAAFMELQFYPPGWVLAPFNAGCDPFKWCAALTIDSYSEDANAGVDNNATCVDQVGVEPINFAFITKTGVADAPANPVDGGFVAHFPNSTTDLLMDPGDRLLVDMHDTPDGFQAVIHDLTSGESGSMIASIANQFGQVKFDPTGTGCTNIPYAFHPMYSTSSEHTRDPWAAHSYNITFSDEIGHFEYCDGLAGSGMCTNPGVNDPGGLDGDDASCFTPGRSSRIQIGGCTSTDNDFDGASYQTVWPGTLADPVQDHLLHPTPVLFSSPLFLGQTDNRYTNYDRVAFEADLPRITHPGDSPNNNCNNITGVGCVNPPMGANFYPIYSIGVAKGGPVWQLGGPNIPGTTNTFGGTSTAEYGPLLELTYPTVGGSITRFNDFRQVLPTNPVLTLCAAPAAGCRTAAKSALIMKHKPSKDTKDKLIWKWSKGEATTLGDLGVPTGTTNYALCLYAGSSSAAIALSAGSKWQAAGSDGYKFSDPSGSPDGAQKAVLKSGAAGKAKALVKGKGADLPDDLAGVLPLPVTAQLVNDSNSTCFEAVYSSATKNDAKQFKAATP